MFRSVALIGGQEVSKFKDGDEQYSVRLRLDDQFRNDPKAMGDLFIPASGGRMVRVSDVSHLALYDPAAAIMRGFRRSLLAYQEEMERQPARHWQLFPNEIEASVSC